MTKKEFIKATRALLQKGEKPEYFIMSNNPLLKRYEENLQLDKPPYLYQCSVPFSKNKKRIGFVFASDDFNRTLSFWRDVLKLTVNDLYRTVKYAE